MIPTLAAAAIRDSVLPPDPGALRRFAALRATLAGLLTFALVLLLGAMMPVPHTERILGFAMGLFTGATVRDPGRAQQAVTMILVALAASAMSVLASFLFDRTNVACAAIVLLAFAATYGAQRGPRWGSVGTVSLIAYLIEFVTRLPPGTIPLRIMVIFIGAGIAAFIRFVLLPEEPQIELRRLQRDLRLALSRVIGDVGKALAAGGWTRLAARQMERQLDRLATMMLMAQTRIAAMSPPPPGLGLHLLELELATGHMGRLALHDLGPPSERPFLHRMAAAMQSALAENRTPGPEPDNATALGRSLALITTLLGHIPEGGPQVGPPPPPPPVARIRPAIQAALAVLLAVTLGQIVSPRWYWAAFTAIVMFQGTRSRGESIRKVAQFMAGTVAGVAAGTVVATFLAAHELLTIAAIIAAVFFAFQAFLTAYAMMIFWITIILGLLFGLLGYFPPQLLLWRLEESAVGAFCGILVACLVMVRPDRDVTETAIAELLRAMNRVVQAAASSLLGAKADPGLGNALLTLESRQVELHEAVRPMLAGFAAGRHVLLRRRMILLTACQDWIRELGHIGLHGIHVLSPSLRKRVQIYAERIGVRVADLANRAGSAQRAKLPGAQPRLPPHGLENSEPGHIVILLARADAALEQLGSIGE